MSIYMVHHTRTVVRKERQYHIN